LSVSLRTWLLALLGLAGCSSGNGGAVVVRWQLVDPQIGPDGKPANCINADPGACCIDLNHDPKALPHDVVVDTVRLRLSQLGDGGESEVACPSCSSACSALEHTTSFDIVPGAYLLSIEALRCGAPVGRTPPEVQRNVIAGEITNLNAIEILIPPGTCTPTSCDDAGAPGCADGGS
jgi:hypothetical protein